MNLQKIASKLTIKGVQNLKEFVDADFFSSMSFHTVLMSYLSV